MSPAFQDIFNIKKINSPLGITLLLLLSIGTTLMVVLLGWPYGIIVLALVLSLFIVLIAFINPQLAYFIYFVSGYLVTIFLKLNEEVPWGVVANVFPILIFFVLIIQKLRSGNLKWPNFNSPVSYSLIGILFWYGLEIANPEGHAILGWIQALREILTYVITFYITLELCRDAKFVQNFIKVWLTCSVISGIYGCIQQHFGFLPFELYWLYTMPRNQLIIVDGIPRIFSIFVSPTTFGISMSMAAIMAITIFGTIKAGLSKFLWAIAIVFMLLGMAYSGTRTASFMLPATLVFYLVMNFNNRTVVAYSLIPIAIFAIIMVLPIYSNYTLNRFRSAFEGNKDPSYNVRDINRHNIQPYMHTHPIGGGIMTTNEEGFKFNPGHALNGWATDSGYVKIALEQGYIGLLVYCFSYWIILYIALKNYLKVKAPLLKIYSLGFLLVLYSITVAHLTQDAIYEHPNVFVYFGLAAIMVKMPELDAQENKLLPVEA